MSELYIMTTAFLDSFSPPLLNGRDQQRRLASPPANCELCGQPLIEQDFPKYTALTCDNWHCHIYRQPQDTREKAPNPEAAPKKTYLSTVRPDY